MPTILTRIPFMRHKHDTAEGRRRKHKNEILALFRYQRDGGYKEAQSGREHLYSEI
ncbi:hypothetical protein J6590_053762 [Homalodisca vitripennis]|nr:hypothetical protein J6590_053762 [Homalodisca vitripennis]